MNKTVTEITPAQFRKLLAERVMGWKRTRRHTDEWWWCDEAAKANTVPCQSWQPDRLPVDTRVITRKMLADGWSQLLSSVGPGKRCEAKFTRRGKEYAATGRDEQEAICWAALQALGIATDTLEVKREE